MKYSEVLKYVNDRLIYIKNNGSGGESPCYCTRWNTWDHLKTVEDVHHFIKATGRKMSRGIAVYSVTKEDDNHKVFIQAAQEYEGATVTECKSRYHGNYKCWMICIPMH